MAVLPNDVLGFDEWAKRLTKDETRNIIEVVAQSNRGLASMAVRAGNETDGNTSVVRGTLPSGTWTSMTEGVASETSSTRELWDAAGTLESFSIIPSRYINRAPDRAAARFQEEKAFMIGLSEEVEDTVFSGDRATNHKEFTGFNQRYNSSTAGNNFGQVVSVAGTGSDMTSIWFVNWGEMRCSLFFGKNNTGGLQTTNLGEDMRQLDASSANHIMAYSTHYEWNVGLMIEDYRSVARVANIDSGTLPALGVIPDAMIDAYYAVPTKVHSPMARWYCNRTIAAKLHKDAMNKTNVNLTLENWDGRVVPHFLGVPIVQTDAISNAETNI